MRGGAATNLALGSLALAACGGSVPPQPDGSSRCVIQRQSFAAGAINPGDACQICNPSLAAAAWTSRPDLTACAGSDAGTYCQLGQCVNACGIDGLVVLAGSANPGDACQVCAPDEALAAWSANPACADGGVPDAGFPDGGTVDAGMDAGGDGGMDVGICVIDGGSYTAGAVLPGDGCQACEPVVSASAPTPRADGTACDTGGDVCFGGACKPGCYLDQGLVAPHEFESDTQDACCNPALSVGAWTPGYRSLAPIALSGAKAIASAAVTAGSAQLIVGTSSGAVDLLTFADGGFTQTAIVAGGPAISGVAAADVDGDGLVDVMYIDQTSPALLAQNASHGFGAAKTWPSIPDGGGLWAEKTPYGAQVLSFDTAYAERPIDSLDSYLQPQIDASGHLLDTCQAPADVCAPAQLAFGSFRGVGNTEFAMTCVEQDGDVETLYGLYVPGWCGDGGWQVSQFLGSEFGKGQVNGRAVAAGDINGDGYFEIVGGGGPQGVALLMNLGPMYGYFADSATPLPLPGGANVTNLAIANLRGDAGGNIIALDTGNSTLDVYYPRLPYDAGVALTASYPAPTSGSALAVGDFDGDGRPDVAVLNPKGVQVFQRQCP